MHSREEQPEKKKILKTNNLKTEKRKLFVVER